MLAHCNILHEQALRKTPPGKLPNFLVRFIIKKIILSPKPFKQGLPTGKELIMTDMRDFGREKQNMLAYLEEIKKRGAGADWPLHPAIGKIKGSEWGYVMWKHLDHHLRQFSV
jgi:hypothetical protein